MLNVIKATAIACLLFTAATASAAIPGHEDNHSFKSENRQGLSATSVFSIYKNAVNVSKDAPMVLFTYGDMAALTGNGSNGDYSLGFASGDILLGQDSFYSGAGWFSAAESGHTTAFTDTAAAVQNNAAKLYASDAKASAIALVPVPLPAAIWAMMSALMGMLYIGRRKSAL